MLSETPNTYTPLYKILIMMWVCGYKAQKNAVPIEIQRFGLYPHLYPHPFNLWVQIGISAYTEPEQVHCIGEYRSSL